MTEIKIYPITSINFSNVLLYAIRKGFTIKTTESHRKDDEVEGSFYMFVEVNQTLTSTQKNTIIDIFKGSAYIEFS